MTGKRLSSRRIFDSLRADSFFVGTKSVLTIHNLGYQGLFPGSVFHFWGFRKDVLRGNRAFEFYGKVNFLKGELRPPIGSPLSPSATPTKFRMNSNWLRSRRVLRERTAHITGILNGVDYAVWSQRATGTYQSTTARAIFPANGIIRWNCSAPPGCLCAVMLP